MPKHVLVHHYRLLVLAGIFMFLALASAGFAIVYSLDQNERTNEEICKQVNELRRSLYLTAIDLGYNIVIAERFTPTERC